MPIMPRSDGLPTNTELLTDFNAVAREVLVTAYALDLQHHLPPSYEGKALAHMRLGLFAIRGTQLASGVTREDAYMTTLTTDVAESLPYHLHFREYPADSLQHYVDVARRLDDVRLDNATDLRSILPAEGVHAAYTANLASGRARHVSTFKEKPTKQTIVSGLYFLKEGLAHLQSDQPHNPSRAKLLLHLIDETEEPMYYRHYSWEHTVDLDLNGYESREFLLRHYAEMTRGAEFFHEKIEEIQSLGGPTARLDYLKIKYQRYNSAIALTQKALDKNTDQS